MDVLPLVFWLLCVIVAAIVIIYLIHNVDTISSMSSEGFISITACPNSTTTYVTSDGSTNCCDSDVVDKQCNGNIVCSLSPKPTNGILTCMEWLMREWRKRSDQFCAPSIPYYYGTIGRKQGSSEGCSASQCTADGSAPSDSTQPTCKIYQTSVDEYGQIDSCFNQKALNTMAVPIPTATKQIIPIGWSGKKYPALLIATYLPPNGTSMVPVTCYDWDRAKIFLDEADPSGKATNLYLQNKDKHVVFCGASKAYYVDYTLTKANAIGV